MSSEGTPHNVTIDDLQNGYRICQTKDGFRFGIDAVLLADFASRAVIRTEEEQTTACPADAGDTESGNAATAGTILDLGCGNGILPLLLAARSRAWSITGLEIQKEAVALAKHNVAMNHLEERISIREGDIREATSIFDAASFDLVVSNPPYWRPSQGKVSPKEAVALARHEIACTFDDVAAAAAYVLKPGGSFCLVHRAPREAEVLGTLQDHGLAPTRLRRVRPFAEREPNLFLAEAVRGESANGAVLSVEEPLTVYEAPGAYTAEILAIYGMSDA